MTAWAGLNLVEIKAGDVIFISGAAGAVGNVAGQLAKLRGVVSSDRPVSAEKLRFCGRNGDSIAAFNYKTVRYSSNWNLAAPDGIDIYFDNVGGETLEAALSALRVHGPDRRLWRHLRLQRGKAAPRPSNLFNMTTKRLT